MSSSKCPSDHTLLQIGTLVHYQEQSFEVVGRVQFLHSAGFWNEWHLLDQKGESWWLGEAMGQFFLFQENPELPTPSRTTLKLGESVWVGQESCALLSVISMEVTKTKGELPYSMTTGTSYFFYDLRSKSRTGFLLKYKELESELNVLHQGQWLHFDELKLENTKPSCPDSPRTRQFECQQCDAPIQLYLGNASHIYYCSRCGTPHDTSSLKPKPLSQMPKAKRVRIDSPILLGDRFVYRETPYICVAIFYKEALLWEALIERESVEQKSTSFKEYLFFHPQKGYRKLYHLQCEWIWSEPTLTIPDPHPIKIDDSDLKRPQLRISHSSSPIPFKYFSSEKARTTNALGEIPCGRSIGQETKQHHYIAPPYILSLQKEFEQLSWSVKIHLSHQELQKQFPDRIFPQPNENTPSLFSQPNPHLEVDKKSLHLLLCFLVSFFLIALYQLFSTEKIHHFSHSVPLLQAPQNQTQEFSFPQQGSMNLRFTASGLTYQYCSLKAILTHQETQTSYQIEPFLERQSLQNEFYLRGMPKGRYTLTWSTYYANYGPKASGKEEASTRAPKLTIEISRSSFTYLALLLSLIVIQPFLISFFSEIGKLRHFFGKTESAENLSKIIYIILLVIHGTLAYFFCSNNFLFLPVSIFCSILTFILLFLIEFEFLHFKADLQTIPLFLIVLILFASNSFFGYGYSSTHTKTNAIKITNPMIPQTFFYKPETYAPGGGRASFK